MGARLTPGPLRLDYVTGGSEAVGRSRAENNSSTPRIQQKLRDLSEARDDLTEHREKLQIHTARIESPSSPQMAGIPSQAGPYDRVADGVIKKIKLERLIDEDMHRIADLEDELDVLFSLLEPELCNLMRLRYLDLMPWPEISQLLWGKAKDFEYCLGRYQKRAYRYHNRALNVIEKYLEDQENY